MVNDNKIRHTYVSLFNINPEISGGSGTHRFSARYTCLANSNIHQAEYRQPSSPHSHTRYRYTHTYDNRNQLTGANYQFRDGSSWANSNEFDLTGLSYDKDGNIQALSRRFEGLNTYSYSYTSGTNRLATVNKNGSNINFGYACPERSRRNPNGNVITIGTGYSITGTTYNWKNLPTAITKSGTIYNYRYDHAGLRVYKQEGDNIHTLRGAFGEVLATYKNGSLDYWNIVRPDGTIIGRREGSNRLYYHRDHLGSTRAVVNASGTVVQTYDYYPFGLEMPGRSLTSGSTARERFTGHERDEEVGLDYMQARRYAAEFGRFLSVDPILSEMSPNKLLEFQDGWLLGYNPYNYTYNNPLIYTDPDGRSVVPFKFEGSFGSAWKKIKEGDWKGAVKEAFNATMNVVQSLSDPSDVVTDLMPGGFAVSQSAKGIKKAADLISAGNMMDKGGLTKAGRSLQKHGSREGSSFPVARGSSSEINLQGENVLSNILNNPDATVITRNHARFGDIMDIRLPDGRGARFSADGKEFIHFLEP